MDPLSRGIKRLQEFGFGVTQLLAAFLEGIAFHNKRYFDRTIISPEPDAILSLIETPAVVWKAQGHLFSAVIRVESTPASGLMPRRYLNKSLLVERTRVVFSAIVDL